MPRSGERRTLSALMHPAQGGSSEPGSKQTAQDCEHSSVMLHMPPVPQWNFQVHVTLCLSPPILLVSLLIKFSLPQLCSLLVPQLGLSLQAWILDTLLRLNIASILPGQLCVFVLYCSPCPAHPAIRSVTTQWG